MPRSLLDRLAKRHDEEYERLRVDWREPSLRRLKADVPFLLRLAALRSLGPYALLASVAPLPGVVADRPLPFLKDVARGVLSNAARLSPLYWLSRAIYGS